MKNDPILEEVWKIRDEYAKEFNYDLRAMYLDLKARQERAGRKAVSLPPRKPKTFSYPE